MIALILDLDGVICDTAHFHFLALWTIGKHEITMQLGTK